MSARFGFGIALAAGLIAGVWLDHHVLRPAFHSFFLTDIYRHEAVLSTGEPVTIVSRP